MNYNVKRSARRTVSLEITDDGGVLVRVPNRMPDSEIEKFTESHLDWIESKLALQQKRIAERNVISGREQELRKKALAEIPPLIDKYSIQMNLFPASVKITSAEKRFGSCSGKNGLCFSWRLMAYPMNAVEYVVVHELAHIKHHNHSKRFYALIEAYLPDYRERQRILRK